MALGTRILVRGSHLSSEITGDPKKAAKGYDHECEQQSGLNLPGTSGSRIVVASATGFLSLPFAEREQRAASTGMSRIFIGKESFGLTK